MKRVFIVTILMFTFIGLRAQVSLSASLDKSVAEVGEPLTLLVTLSGGEGDISLPQLPSLPSFSYSYEGDSKESEIITVNNRTVMTLSRTFGYRLIPRFAGRVEIGPITYKYQGATYSTAPMFVDVYKQGDAKPGQSSPQAVTSASPAAKPASKPAAKTQAYAPVFLKSGVDKKTTYAGEQITFSLDFYNSVELRGDSGYRKPSFEGFVTEEMDADIKNETLDGVKYLKTSLNYALFGITPGKKTISKSSVSFTRVHDFEILGHKIGESLEAGAVSSSPVTVEVLPLPEEGRGDSFYGAVGAKFSVLLQADKTDLETGDSATLTLTVRGQGNLKAVTSPGFNIPPAFKSYETEGTSNIAPIDGVVQGMKTFKTVLIPLESGTHTVNGVKFTYFDTQEKKYKTLVTQDIVFNVRRSSGGGTGAVSFGGAQTGGVQSLGSDISYIKENAGVYKPGVLAARLPLGLINALSLFLVFFSLAAFVSKDKIKKMKSVCRAARARIERAKDAGGISAAFIFYFSARTARAAAGMKIKDILSVLRALYGISGEVAARAEDFWNTLDTLKYAPVKTEVEFSNLKHEALALLSALDKEIRNGK